MCLRFCLPPKTSTRASLRQKTWQNKSSFFLTDGALAEWGAPKKLERWTLWE
jgi:hypothetical protein